MWRACLVCMKLFFMQFLRAFDLCIRCSFDVFDLLVWNWYLNNKFCIKYRLVDTNLSIRLENVFANERSRRVRTSIMKT